MKVLSLYISIALSSTSLLLNSFKAKADIFSDLDRINQSVNEAKKNVENTGSTLNGLGGMLGIGKNGNNSGSVDSNTQVLNVYADWYKVMSPLDRDVARMLTTEYAEKGSLDFTTFKATKFYTSSTIEQRQKISAVFFKFNEIVKAVQQKDKFLAFAFCVNGGSTSCK
jgi:hypothetical protein